MIFFMVFCILGILPIATCRIFLDPAHSIIFTAFRPPDFASEDLRKIPIRTGADSEVMEGQFRQPCSTSDKDTGNGKSRCSFFTSSKPCKSSWCNWFGFSPGFSISSSYSWSHFSPSTDQVQENFYPEEYHDSYYYPPYEDHHSNNDYYSNNEISDNGYYEHYPYDNYADDLDSMTFIPNHKHHDYYDLDLHHDSYDHYDSFPDYYYQSALDHYEGSSYFPQGT